MTGEPTTPFTFRPAPAKPGRKTAPEKTEDAEATPLKPVRKRAAVLAEPKKTRKRRAKLPNDTLVLKACLKHLRTLDPKDALRTVETLRVLFK